MPRLLLLCWCVLLAATARAQPVMERLTRADGLPSDYVFGLAQDRTGYLWFGTDAGVARYDGDRFETFTIDDGLPHPLVYDVVQDRDGTLWAGTYSGLARFDGRRFVPEATPARQNRARLDGHGRLLVYGTGVSVREGPGRWRSWSSPALVQQVIPLPDGSVLALALKAPGFLPLRLRPVGTSFVADTVRLPCTQPSRGAMWVLVGAGRYGVACAEGGVYDVAVRDGRVAFGPRRSPRLLPSHILPDGSFLSGQLAQVVWKPLQGAPVPVVPARTEAFLTDYEGTTWLGTFGKGVWRLRTLHLRRLTSANMLRLARDASGAVWATAEDGVWRVAPGDTVTHPTAFALRHPYLRALAVRGSNLAAVSAADLVWTFPGRGEQSVSASWVSGLEATTDTLYATSYGMGLIRLYDGRRDTLRAGRGLPDDVLEDVFRLPSGLWMLTRSFGALRLRPADTVEVLGRREGLPSSSVFSLYETAAGVRYVGTDRGIARLAPGRRAEVLGAAVLRGRRVVALFERPSVPGVVWAVADQALVRLDGSSVQRLDGFTLVPSRAASVTAALYEPVSDRLFLATTEGLVVAAFSPGALGSLPPPRIALRTVLVDDRPAADGFRAGAVALADLPPGLHRVEVRVAPLSFVAGTEAEFRVNGGAWRRLGAGRVLVLPQVGRGRYRVEVRAVNAEGRVSERPAVLAFAVPPFWWERWWFAVLVGGVVAAGVVAVARWLSLRRLRQRLARLEAERAREREREHLSRDLHDHVGGQLTALVSAADLIGEAARRGDDARVQIYADAVSVEARNALGQLRQTVVALRHHGLSAADLFRQLQEQAASQLRFEPDLQLIARFAPTTPDDEMGPMPVEVVFQTMQVAREALTNVVRHARAQHVALALAVGPDALELTVEDDGIGFDANASRTGSGLDIMRARAADVGAALAVGSGANGNGNGTRIVWRVALGRNG